MATTYGSVLGTTNSNYFTDQTNSSKSIKELAYKAYIVASEQGIIVEGWLPETMMMDVNAKYDPPFEQGLSSIGSMQGLGNMARFLGLSLTTQAMTAQIWQGGSFIDLSVPMVFQAETGAGQDVMTPIKNLLKLTMPQDPSGGGFLTAPGPRLDITKLPGNTVNSVGAALTGSVSGTVDTAKDIAGGRYSEALSKVTSGANKVAAEVSSAIVSSVVNNFILFIGQFLYFPSVVITDVSPTYDVIIGTDKNPMRATVNVGIRTFYMPTSGDIDTMFPSTINSSPAVVNRSGR